MTVDRSYNIYCSALCVSTALVTCEVQIKEVE